MTLRAAAVLCIAAASSSSAQQPTAAPGTVPGIVFSVDTSVLAADARGDTAVIRLWSAFASYNARVTFASGRGRMDILSQRPNPALIVDKEISTAPLARPGEYYLFDSTGFVLVHPATKTFTRFTIADDAFRHEIWRDGWPRGFRTLSAQISPAASAAASAPTTTRIYWHANAGGGVIAYGRLSIHGAPAGELNVARWFGAARSLARLVDSTRRLPTGELTVTAAIPRTTEAIGPPTYLLKQRLTNLEIVAVDTAGLRIPNGFGRR